MKKFILFAIMVFAVTSVFGETKWVDATTLNICGHTIENAKNPYSRINSKEYGFTNNAINSYSRYSTGLYIMFKTNSKNIYADWIVSSAKQRYNVRYNITAATQFSVDLYIKVDGKWRFCNIGRVSTDKEVVNFKKALAKNMAEGEKECMLYLPLWSEVKELKIGVDEDATIKAIPSPYKHRVIFYGTSTTHGASPSRPGLSMLARMSRDLGIDFVNFSYSGQGKMEPESAEVIADCKTDAVICYCFGNTTAQEVEERVDGFTERLVKAHPGKPIIFIRPFHTPERFFDLKRKAMYAEKLEVITRKMKALTKRYKDVYYLDIPTAHGTDNEDTIDNSHLNDMGFDRVLKAYEPKIAKILKKYGIK